jgi:hypothetical protein
MTFTLLGALLGGLMGALHIIMLGVIAQQIGRWLFEELGGEQILVATLASAGFLPTRPPSRAFIANKNF